MAKAPKLKVYCTPVGFYDARAELEQREAAIRKQGEIKLIELGRTRDRVRAAYERALHRSRSRV